MFNWREVALLRLIYRLGCKKLQEYEQLNSADSAQDPSVRVADEPCDFASANRVQRRDNRPDSSGLAVLIWYWEAEGFRGQIGQFWLDHNSLIQRIDVLFRDNS